MCHIKIHNKSQWKNRYSVPGNNSCWIYLAQNANNTPKNNVTTLNHNSRNTNRCFKIPVTRSAEKICCLLWYHAILYCMTSVFENAFYDGQLNINKRALLFGRLRGIWFEAHVAQGWQNNTSVIFKLNYSSYRSDHRLRSWAAGNEMLITSAYAKLEKYSSTSSG